MKVKIFIGLKKTILDPQGRAVQHALESLGFAHVKDVRMGKFVEIEFSPQSEEAIRKQVTEMCEKLLANTVIEEYYFELES